MSDPIIYLAHVEYGGGPWVAESCRSFYTQAVRPKSLLNGKLILCNGGGSLLALHFNTFWVHALNLQEMGEKITHFGMLHDDVVPDLGWLDVLYEDLVAHKADIMSAVVPIKDPYGVVSTAIDDPNDEFMVERRLTMREVFSLPEVFSAADCGYPDRHLLVNTGCWLCDFTKPWRHKVHFTIKDRITCTQLPSISVGTENGHVGHTQKRRWETAVAPEDWNFSRQVQKLGGKVMATRRVTLGHGGGLSYSNRQPWGEWQQDKNLVAKHKNKVVGKVAIPVGYAGDVEGWLEEDEGRYLSEAVRSKTVLEIGSYCGKSTVWMATTAAQVDAVDTFDSEGTCTQGVDTLVKFKTNLDRYKLGHKVRIFQGRSREIVPELERIYDVVFIDGSHDYRSVMADTLVSLKVLKWGGLLIYHDYHTQQDPDVTKAVDELCATGEFSLVDVVGSLAVVQPKNAELFDLYDRQTKLQAAGV